MAGKEFVKKLLLVRNRYGETVLHRAVSNEKHPDVMSELLNVIQDKYKGKGKGLFFKNSRI